MSVAGGLKQPSISGNGFSLMVRHPGLLAGLFTVNLVLGAMASVAPRAMFAPALDHSLHASELVNGFSASAFVELASRPEVSFGLLLTQSYLFAFLYLVFTLFAAGGVVTAYSEDRALGFAEFFEASGRFFLRMVRLALLAAIPFGAVAFAVGILFGLASAAGEATSYARAGFYVFTAGAALLYLFALLVRAWFDVAQARMIDRREFSVLKITFGTLKGVMHRSPALVWAYLKISVISWLLCAALTWIWVRQAHAAIWTSFVLFEAMLVISLAARLWQRATAIASYQRYLVVEEAQSLPEPWMQTPASMPESHSPEAVSEPAAPSNLDTSQDAGHSAV